MSVTLRQIAARAGVSATTVSFALRNHPKISEATRRRVREVADAMGYKPDPYVSILMANKRSNQPVKYEATLGFLTAWPERDGWQQVKFCRDVFVGVRTRAAALGFQVEPFWIADPEIPLRRWEQIFLARNITGMILAPLPKAGAFPDLTWENFTLATAGNTVLSPRVSKVTPHQYHGMAMALREVEHMGYRRVGLVLDRWVDDKVDATWSAAFLAWQSRKGPEERLPVFWSDQRESPVKELRAWMRERRPDVIIGYGYRLLTEAGVRCPEQVAFVHLDLQTARKKTRFAGVNQSAEDVGHGVVDLVVAQLHRNERGLPALPKTMMIEGYWERGPSLPERG